MTCEYGIAVELPVASGHRRPPLLKRSRFPASPEEASMRSGEVKRRTSETDIAVSLHLDGTG